MIFCQLSLKNRKILVIGGGRQAYLKGSRLEEEGAEVFYIAGAFLEEFKEKRRVQKDYEKEDLAGFFLVYACTGSKSLNHRIVLDANEQGALSASIHKDEDAVFHAARGEEIGEIRAAVSTNGVCPAFGGRILKDIRAAYETEYNKTLPILGRLRKEMLTLSGDDGEKRNLLKELCYACESELLFYERAMREKSALIYVFEEIPEAKARRRMEEIAREADGKRPSYFACRREEDALLYNRQNTGDRMLSLKKLEENLKIMSVSLLDYQSALPHCLD